MDPLILIFAMLVGYFSGSVSYARLVARWADPQRKISRIRVNVPGYDDFLESDSISATTVRLQYGGRYGGLVALLDMLKAALPMLAFRLWQPDQPYYLVASVMAVVGHNWPVFYRFKGGRGLSCVTGSFFVLDWLGALVTNIAAFLLGYPTRNMLVITGAGIVLMIPWVAVTTRDWLLVAYVVVMNGLYWYKMIPELKELARLRREGKLDAFRKARSLAVLQEDGEVRYDTHTLENVSERIKQRFRRR